MVFSRLLHRFYHREIKEIIKFRPKLSPSSKQQQYGALKSHITVTNKNPVRKNARSVNGGEAGGGIASRLAEGWNEEGSGPELPPASTPTATRGRRLANGDSFGNEGTRLAGVRARTGGYLKQETFRLNRVRGQKSD